MRSLVLCLILLLIAGSSYAQKPRWKRVPGLDGGELYQIAAVGSILFVATETGIYRSKDDAQGWEPVMNGLPDSPPQIIAIGHTLVTGDFAGVWRSTDLGQHWIKTNYPKDTAPRLWVTNGIVYSEDAWPTDVVGPFDGVLFASTDSGMTWQEASQSDSLPRATPSRSAFGYSFITWRDSMGNTKVLRTRDSVHYDTASYEGDGELVASSVEELSPKYLVGQSRTFRGMFGYSTRRYTSLDSGRTWRIFPLDSEARNVREPWVRTIGNVILISTENGIGRSTDSGAMWTTFLTGRSPQLVSMGPRLYLKGAKWIFESNDTGAHWRTLSSKGIRGEISEIAAANGHILARSVNGWQILDRNDWRPFPKLGWSDPADSAVQHGSSGDVFACALPAGVLVYSDSTLLLLTTNLGRTWHEQGRTPAEYAPPVPIQRTDGSGAFMIETDSIRYFSTDLGKQWFVDTSIHGIIPGGATSYTPRMGFLTFATEGNGRHLVLTQAATTQDFIQDSGVTRALPFDSASEIRTAAIGNDVVVTFHEPRRGNHSLISSDGFATWAAVKSTPRITALVVSHDRIYAATTDGVYVLGL